MITWHNLSRLIVIACGVFFVIFLFQDHLREFFSGSALEVIFLDVGQGDSALIRTPQGQQMLIDGGPDRSVLYRVGEHLPFWDRTIDVVILTHPDKDHITGLIEILKRYTVKEVWISGQTHTTAEFRAWTQAIEERNIPQREVQGGDTWMIEEDVIVEILHPSETYHDSSLNNTSIVMRVSFHDATFLFTGDIEASVESLLLKQNVDVRADVLKTAHHGSKTSSTEAFLLEVNPKVVVISSGKNNRFGHPHLRVLRRFERQALPVYRTDEQGSIVIRSDGVSLSVCMKRLACTLIAMPSNDE